MPIVWRYLLQGYLRVFCLSVSTFIAVLFVIRFKEIARFAALSADLSQTALFVLYQFPLILPIAIPISALIASLLLFQRLSRTCELTALRSCGAGLKTIFSPILFAALLLTLLNFSITAELSPFCRREMKAFLYQKTSNNPLLLLQRQQLVKMKNAYLNMKVKNEGQSAKDLLLIAYNDSNDRLTVVLAEKLWMKTDLLHGKNMAVLSYLKNDKKEGFDPIVLENQTAMHTFAPLLSQAMKKHRPRIDPSSLSFRHLIVQKEQRTKKGHLAWVEMLRRYSLSGAVFTFSLLGCAFGIELGRRPTKKGLFIALALTMAVLVSYLLGKSLKSEPVWAALALFCPHPLVWAASLRRLHQVNRGVL